MVAATMVAAMPDLPLWHVHLTTSLKQTLHTPSMLAQPTSPCWYVYHNPNGFSSEWLTRLPLVGIYNTIPMVYRRAAALELPLVGIYMSQSQRFIVRAERVISQLHGTASESTTPVNHSIAKNYEHYKNKQTNKNKYKCFSFV